MRRLSRISGSNLGLPVSIIANNKVRVLSPPQFLKNRGKEGKAEKRAGKGGKSGKAEKAREKGKSEESLCQISVEIWQKLSISDRTQPECRLSFS